jgi:hypothetical protein
MINDNSENLQLAEKAAILLSLQPLFAEARTKKLWFYCKYHSLWFSPAELQAEHDNEKFIWGTVNWELRDPNERITELKDEILFLIDSIYNWRIRMQNNNK